MQSLKEGKAEIEISEEVFFNPKMRTLRDISVALLNAVDVSDCSVLDATAASGIRGIRYALETKSGSVTLVDINPKACAMIKRNMKRNKVNGDVVNQSFQDFANVCSEKFDVIDIDPFGTPTPFVYDALKICKEGTILMVTATDTAVLCGAQRLACSKMYGSIPLHNELCHESGLRILINYILRNAAQYDLGIEVLLAVSDMHYMRVFLRLRRGAKRAFGSVSEVGFVDHCNRCHNFRIEYGLAAFGKKECEYCGANVERAGPMWLGRLKDDGIVKKMTKNSDRKFDSYGLKLIGSIDAELDTPFFYSIPHMTKYLKIGSVSTSNVISELGKKHRTTPTYFDRFSLKTEAKTDDVVKTVKKVAGKKA